MPQTTNARRLLRRIYPWLGRVVHTRWSRRRGLYQEEAEALLAELGRIQGRTPPPLAFKLEGFLGRLHREWFPEQWRQRPTYAEVVRDFEWWLDIAERWGEAPAKNGRTNGHKPPKRAADGPPAKQPMKLLRLLSLPADCSHKRFVVAWRQFLKENHPDLNPEQSAEERRLFKEAVALWRR
jgi:hypothetical protein